MRTLVWFRNDLRIHDNPALAHACRQSTAGVVGLFAACPDQWRQHDWGANKAVFMLRNVTALAHELKCLNIPFRFLQTPRFDTLPRLLLKLAADLKCETLAFNRELEVNEQSRDQRVTDALTAAGLRVLSFDDQTILPPREIRTGTGGFYTVYTPFLNAFNKRLEEITLLPPPGKQPPTTVESDTVPESLPGYTKPSATTWLFPPGEQEAVRRLDAFLQGPATRYHTDRDTPALDGGSSLSPYLAAGVISPRRCFMQAQQAARQTSGTKRTGIETWIKQLVWREFYRHVLIGFPRICRNRPFKLSTEKLHWTDNPEHFERWCAGQTGVPIVDAAIRQLRSTGFMHNRLRMITAMYLTKDLLIDWRRGEQFFMDHLVDADLPNNNGGWQWSASTGTDAAPYFRIFNPYTQSERFDKHGRFIRVHCPELADLDDNAIHDPSRLPPLLRAGLDYPEPLVDHAWARQRAIDLFKSA